MWQATHHRQSYNIRGLAHAPRASVSRCAPVTPLILILLCGITPLLFARYVHAEPPNIVVILSDDMGYSDIGCYGGEIETPNLDRLAAGGVRFSQFYNTARCCPTRASLLTGLYPHQAGVGHMMEDRGHDGYRGDLNNRCVTLAEVLSASGYATYATGKWHVTPCDRPGDSQHNWPLQRGFDRFYGTIHGGGSFYDPFSLVRDNEFISPFADPEYQPEQFYYTDAISDHTVRFIREHGEQSPDQPFFCYVAYTCAHWPMHALEEDIAKYEGRYDEGYAVIRERRLARMRELGLNDSEWEVTPQAEDWDAVENRAWELRCMEVFAAMIDNMDRGIGRIVAELEAQGELDNTLILYMQDNGGCAEGIGRTAADGYAIETTDTPTLPVIAADALQTESKPHQTRDGRPVAMGPDAMPGPDDTYIAYGRGWANVSNTPFREYKHWVHEGGISTPLIAHWPAGIARVGEIEVQPGHLIDIMATCVDIAGVEYPTEFNGQAIRPMEGRSLAVTFDGGVIDRDHLYWEHEGNRAIRWGDWKLVARGEDGEWELYDMGVDRTEMHDLAGERSALVEELAAKWEAWAERCNVYPLNPEREADLNRDQLRFELGHGDELPRESAPFITRRSFVIDIAIEEWADDGVLISQGGDTRGYAVYVKDGIPHAAVRCGGQQHEVVAEERPATSPRSIQFRFHSDGRCELLADDHVVGTGDAGEPLEMPQDGLQVGRDNETAVGSYEPPFEFTGRIGGVFVTLEE